VSIKVRLHDFSTVSRSATLSEPSDDGRQIARVARRLLAELDTSSGVRLLGVGVSGFADWIQEDLFADDEEEVEVVVDEATEAAVIAASRHRGWSPGMDVVHEEHGRGWVWGSGRGVVTVRFETADTPPGRVLSFAVDEPALTPYAPPEE
jgi:DNA polymerase-4